MNAPLPPEAVAVATLPVIAITPSPSNPRKHFDDAYIAELAESIKAHGLIQPITVRPLPLERHFEFNRKNIEAADHPAYELVVGECRWRAAKLAGLTEVPGFWRELDDKAVLEIQVIENLQRRDVHPIEEAEGYEQLMQRHGYKADEIAAKIGKSRGYVYARLKLTALQHEAREAFFAGKLDASTALLIARIPGAALQKRATKEITEGYDNQPLSYRNAKNHIRCHFTISLQQATFPLDDSTLVPTAGSCTTCPKRSGNSSELCADLDSEDVCTDTQCFDDKRLTRRQQLIDNAEKRGVKVFTGEKARELAPHGLHSLDERQLVSLDEAIEGDSQDRTYRDILGEKTPVAALLELPWGDKALVELGEPKALSAALRKAGWQPDLLKVAEATNDHEKKEREDSEREARKLAAENEAVYRQALATAVIERTRQLANAGECSINTDQLVALLATAWLRFDFYFNEELDAARLERFGITLPVEPLPEGQDDYDDQTELEKVVAIVATWPVGTALAFLFDVTTSEETNTNIYRFNPEIDKPHTLLALAKLVDFDPASLHPTSPDGSETATDPTQAAQAQGEGAADSAAPAKPKGKKKTAAKKGEAKAEPAPTSSANEPAAPVKPISAWPFPTVAEAA